MNILLLGIMILSLVSVVHARAGTFLLDNEGWIVNQGYNKIYKPGYKPSLKEAEHYKYNTGIMNHYITGKDAIVNVDWKNKDDRDLWYFVSPIKIVGKGPFAITYSMSSFMGDYKKMNAGVRERAIILKAPTYELWVSLPTEYDGTQQNYWIPLIGATIQKKDNDGRFSRVSDRDLPKLLEKVNEIAILGDWTQGIEMLGLDNVAIEEM